LEVLALGLVIVTAFAALLRVISPATVDEIARRVGLTPTVGPITRPEAPIPEEPVALTGLWIKGATDAPVAMILFEDYECPACTQFETTALEEIEAAYVASGKVRLAVWHRPLPQHRRAVPAAAAAECAGREGQFWQMRHTLFRNPQRMGDADLAELARDMGLREFEACYQDETTASSILTWMAAAKAFGVNGTPTVFVGKALAGDRLQVNTRWSGSRSFADVARIIEGLLLAGE
jgi:protein-disulfide isomerase